MRNECRQQVLSFEYASADGTVVPHTFRNPVKVIRAEQINDVIPALRSVQEAVDAGLYAAGFLSYEAAPAFDPAYRVKEGHSMPLLWFGIFAEPEYSTLRSSGPFAVSDWKPDTGEQAYREAIGTIKQAIESGETYQTNYTIRLLSQFRGDEVALFERMKRAQACSYSAYINTGEHAVLSASPELFFRVKDGRITARPMKGTAKRGKTSEEDHSFAQWLAHSEKNRAENVMIVDLLRNDLGRIAKTGSVKVPKLFEIERYPTVHQMTSTVEADLEAGTDLIDVFGALFPCGSITGAPKVSTMDLISTIEQAPREVYCGAIGFITPEREAVFNVPIRTVVIDRASGNATYGVGGGITWDSTSEEEYGEILAKSSFLELDRPEFSLLESLLLEDGCYFLKEAHLDRMSRSARYFGFPFDRESVSEKLEQMADKQPEGHYKIRCLLGRDGLLSVEAQEIAATPRLPEVTLAVRPVDREDPFLYHKTTHRAVYEEHAVPGSFDVLLWNQDGKLTEFINGNLVLEIGGRRWTPPVTAGLLAGTYREALLEQGIIRERELDLSDLESSTRIWMINSVRKWVEVRLVNKLEG
ncbi:Para-aminobenzoate synthase component 1 [Bhargavaea cecembensis DSE10]|uniref:Para-aminobenzoate synthase component 1 n=1 Tax=Bhargavaea cecembensis DSE10 TaxID=1235279 RepID=M7NWE1_9BACL|nr:aminodeoxychorismate synthase component I [Bhargavaea cecembensis]EMR05975.1 Para-aminobenzoate synthase component 1 [Bhargavaea cecembensis DSE10]